MIRVRYRDPSELSPGLHAAAERHGRTTTVYLLSGLTAAERHSALRRLRLSARMGHCPRLPAAQLRLALLASRIRTSIGQAGAVFRLHPAGSTVPVMVLSGAVVAFLLFSTVSIRVLPGPRTGPASGSSPSPAASATALPITRSSAGAVAGLISPAPGGSSLATSPSLASRRGGPVPVPAAVGGAQDSTGAGGTTLSGAADPTTPAQGATTAPAAATLSGGGSTPSSAPQPQPRRTPGSPGPCLKVGPLGVCLNV
jgi:hypothetical protein